VSEKSRRLTGEERVLWARVARTTRPLKGQPAALEMLEPEPEPPVRPADDPPSGGTLRPTAGPKDKRQIHALDQTTRRKLSKGRLAIDARIDLHGLQQSEAYGLLLSFLHRAFAAELRYVLVITGKGASLGSEGVLRRAVPAWLGTPSFRGLVSGYEDASRNHGGSGALYVRLRRRSHSAG
jgi:DNA-nicking Smr family endonuclease